MKGIVAIPQYLNIMGYEYEVKMVSGREIQEVMQDLRNEYKGAIGYDEQVIYLNDELNWNEQTIMETLIHEVIHAVEHYMRLNFDEDTVEKLGIGLGPVLCQLLGNE